MIPGPAGRIEALLAAPLQPRVPPVFAIVCHPHPLFGGAMSNKVAYMLAASAQKSGVYALRFNFRGVGRSEGRHDGGHGETDDVEFLVHWMHERLPGARVVLMGFSFGAWVSVRAARHLHPVAQVSIAPPFGKYVGDEAVPQRPPCPWLVVHGLDDEVVDYGNTKAVLDAYDPPPELVTLDGVGHFFHGRLTELGGIVQAFLQRQLG
ncbi:alpha/beta fold hydrolase [Fontimonas sp. SYSU GA230001]|uniref:alpha/beta hydrolase n=1 Tax=Fontimonas sp. SYSU GA230001 TaxID=3142450 RepID=UPI0032B41A3D